MKIEVIESGSDYEETCEISIDGNQFCSVGDMSGCPEDANLMRGLGFVYDIPDVIEKAYKAGVNGEELEIVFGKK